MNKKEYNKAMEEMECWSVQNHLKKCSKCRAGQPEEIVDENDEDTGEIILAG